MVSARRFDPMVVAHHPFDNLIQQSQAPGQAEQAKPKRLAFASSVVLQELLVNRQWMQVRLYLDKYRSHLTIQNKSRIVVATRLPTQIICGGFAMDAVEVKNAKLEYIASRACSTETMSPSALAT